MRMAGGGALGKTGQKYTVVSVSANIPDPNGAPEDATAFERDCEFWVPYSDELILPDIMPTIGKTFANTMKDDRMLGPIAKQLKDYILVWKEGEQLIFARDIRPSDALENSPSSSWNTRDTWKWPAVLRSWDVQFVVNDGNLIDIVVSADIVDEQALATTFLYEQFWSVIPWPEEMLRRVDMQPGRFEWRYPSGAADAKGSFFGLHPEVQVPPFPGGITGYERFIRQGKEYAPTNVTAWRDDTKYDSQKQIRGRWFRERCTALVPYSTAIYPPPPRVYAS